MIYAEHAWKVNALGEPLAKYFNDSQWSSTHQIKRLVDGKIQVFPNSGWIATETPGKQEPDLPDEPLKKVAAKKTTRKRKVKAK